MIITPVILSGGSGSRLWPLSRATHPKQFLALTSDHTMLQNTALRAKNIPNTVAPILLCNADHRFIAAEQLQNIDINAELILEPEGRNTAPSIAIAALQAAKKNKDALLLVLPADHLIKDDRNFVKAIDEAANVAKQGYLVTFGITATHPATGYGYIQQGDAIEGSDAFHVDTFIEKPDQITAEKLLQTGTHYWNSGMFLFSAQVYLEEIKAHAPNILTACEQALHEANKDLDFIRLGNTFKQCPDISIDYAVMEHTQKAAVVPADITWSDVGSWSSLWDVKAKDQQGNILEGDVHCEQVANSYIAATSRMVSAVGISDHVIIETPDAVLVTDKNSCQDVSTLVKRLKALNRKEANEHQKVYRPWGSYESIVQGIRFQVKHIMINPGAALSLQLHHHRAEHWVVVRGIARVTRDQEQFDLKENESTFIPVGVKHRLENLSDNVVEMIEVQSGSYLGEDDIVRFEDRYDRS